MCTIDLTRKSNTEMIDIVNKTGRTAGKWDDVKRILGLKKVFPE